MFSSEELSAVEILSEVMKVCFTRWRSLRITRPPLLFLLLRTGTMSQIRIIISSKELSAVEILSKVTKVCFTRCRSIACIVEPISLIREDNQVHLNEWLFSFTSTIVWSARPCVIIFGPYSKSYVPAVPLSPSWIRLLQEHRLYCPFSNVEPVFLMSEDNQLMSDLFHAHPL